MKRVLCLLASAPDLRALAPVLEALDAHADALACVRVANARLRGAAEAAGVRIDHELADLPADPPSAVVSRVLAALDPLLTALAPDLLLVHGASTTTLAAALAGFHRRVPVAHLGAGRHHDEPLDAFPEEANRRLLTPLATLHLAPAARHPATPPEASARAVDMASRSGEAAEGARIAREIADFVATPGPAAPHPTAPQTLADLVEAARAEIHEITPEEAHRVLLAPDHEGWHFVDVREPDEFAAGHVPGARSRPRGFLEVRADLEHYKRDPWLADRERPLILYCGGGHRSALAAQTLRRMGFRRVCSLAEGWTGWTARGYPVERSAEER